MENQYRRQRRHTWRPFAAIMQKGPPGSALHAQRAVRYQPPPNVPAVVRTDAVRARPASAGEPGDAAGEPEMKQGAEPRRPIRSRLPSARSRKILATASVNSS